MSYYIICRRFLRIAPVVTALEVVVYACATTSGAVVCTCGRYNRKKE
ncbi:MAG: hypothetical protein ACKOZV_05360 [Bacteroidota bacterium]